MKTMYLIISLRLYRIHNFYRYATYSYINTDDNCKTNFILPDNKYFIVYTKFCFNFHFTALLLLFLRV